MVAYVVEKLDTMTLDIASLDGRYDNRDFMSPFVWKEGACYRLMVRVLPRPLGPTDPTGVIWCGSSTDGLHFDIHSRPSILPGPGPIDCGGCEDPTVIRDGNGGYIVYYTGVDATRTQGSMLVASGSDLLDLEKTRVILKAPEGEGNIKEATLAQARDGTFRLFYEYARDNASRIGMASGPTAEGPWTVLDDPFTIRDDSWDNWHLSTGPIIEGPSGDQVMFYNGATVDARWRIGWIAFSPDFSRVTGRGIEPILMPPPAKDRSAPDIAFAASCVIEGEDIFLYYSLEDSILRRATIHQYGPPRTG